MKCNTCRDFNYPDKKAGYLAQTGTDFEFIGPDKEPVNIDSIEKLIIVKLIPLGIQVCQTTKGLEYLLDRG